MLPYEKRSAEEPNKELEERLAAAFDGADWALHAWVRRNFGSKVSHGLPGLLAPFDHLCHEASLVIARHGQSRKALLLLKSGRESGGWTLQFLAASRHVPLMLIILALGLVVGVPITWVLAFALGVALAPEVRRWWSRRGETGLRVSSVRPLLVVGSVVVVLSLSSSLQGGLEPSTTNVRVEPREASKGATSPASSEELAPEVEPLKEASVVAWPKYSPSWDDVPECMADVMREQQRKGRRLVALDRVRPGADATTYAVSGINLRRLLGSALEVTACCSTCVAGRQAPGGGTLATVPLPVLAPSDRVWDNFMIEPEIGVGGPRPGKMLSDRKALQVGTSRAATVAFVARDLSEDYSIYADYVIARSGGLDPSPGIDGGYFPGETLHFGVTVPQ